MRFYLPKNGSIRKIKKFLFFPKTIGRERRWWEKAEWEEKHTCGTSYHYWEVTKWLNP